MIHSLDPNYILDSYQPIITSIFQRDFKIKVIIFYIWNRQYLTLG